MMTDHENSAKNLLKAPDNKSRRKFIGIASGVTGMTLLAPGIFLNQVAQAKTDAEAASSKVRWGMLIDTNKCKSGCNDCVSACADENGWKNQTRNNEELPNEVRVQWMRKVELKGKKTGREVSLPVMCQHCEKPPCVDVCPTGASFKRDDGIVLVDKHTCIGCRYCMMACPYKARSFVHSPVEFHDDYMPRGMGTVESCTFCVHLVDKNKSPACVSSCNEKAIMFGDLNDKNSDISKRVSQVASRQIRGDLRTDPGVRYQGL